VACFLVSPRKQGDRLCDPL